MNERYCEDCENYNEEDDECGIHGEAGEADTCEDFKEAE